MTANDRRGAFLLRVAVACLFTVFAVRVGAALYAQPSVTLFLAMAGETVSIVLVIIAIRPSASDRSPFTAAITIAATFYFLAIQLTGGKHLLPEAVTVPIQCAGILTQVFAKLTLGRRFGLLPANRGIATNGPYRWIRHPMYLGYFLQHVGFFLATASTRNLIVLAVLYTLQVLRILAEERLLLQDAEYVEYAKHTRWRAIPFVF